MTEEGRRNRKPMRRRVLKPHGGIRCGMHRGGGDIQILGTYFGPIRRRLAGGPQKFQEGAPSMFLAKETSKERGGGPVIFRNVLSGSGASGIIL